MVEHVAIPNDGLHEPKDIDTATDGQIYVANGAGGGDWQDLTLSSDLIRNNVVTVNSLSDFPAPISGVIPLESFTNYELGAVATIETPDRFQLGLNTNINGFNALLPQLRYTGSGTMFTGVDTTFSIDGLFLDCPNGQLFDLSSTTALHVFAANNMIVQSATKFGTFTSMFSVDIDNVLVQSCLDGITAVGPFWSIFTLRSLAMFGLASTKIGVDLGTSVHSKMTLNNCILSGTAGAFGFAGAAASANISTGTVGFISGCEFIGGLTPLSVISVDDIRLNFQGNAGVPDTYPDALLSMTSNSTNTVISTPGVGVLVAGTWVSERSSMFDNTAAGRTTHVGERALITPISAVVDVEPASGTNKDITAFIAINGAAIAASGRTVRTDSSNPVPLPVIWQSELLLSDYVEVFVTSADATDVLVSGAVLRMR